MKQSTRARGASALGAGGLCWGVNLALMLSSGSFSPTLVLLGGLGIAAGAVLAVWGDSFKTMPLAQKIPAVLIALTLVGVLGVGFSRWLESLR